MRSRSSLRVHAVVAWVAALWLTIGSAQNAPEYDSPSDDDIAAAIETLKSDPNLTPERKTRTLKWAGETKPSTPSSFGEWFKNFFVWIGQAGYALIWVIGGLLAIALVWFLIRLFTGAKFGDAKQPNAPVPTHVRDLDIRPESLPSDIGAAALALWERGDHRAALALLYRGLLSRLAHVHRLPIRDSSTEGDCLELAAKHLPLEHKQYVARLIGLWQRATYGAQDVQANEVEALCAGFDKALADAPASLGERT